MVGGRPPYGRLDQGHRGGGMDEVDLPPSATLPGPSFPAGSRTATLRIPYGPWRISPRLPCRGPLRRPCMVTGQLPHGSSSGPSATTLRIPPRSPMTTTLQTGPPLADRPSTSCDEYPTDGTPPYGPPNGPLHDLRADLATATRRTPPPLRYGSLHDLRANLATTTLRIPPCLPYGSHPCGSPHKTPADPRRLPCGPLTPTLRTPPRQPYGSPHPPPKGPPRRPCGVTGRLPQGTPWGPCVPHRATSWTLPYKEDPSGKTSQARSASQSPGPEGGPPPKKRPLRGRPPPPKGGKNLGAGTLRLAWAFTRARLRVRSLPC